MPRKKPPNWEDIKTRYTVNGEKPADIAKIYDVSPKTISNRASEEDWREESGRIGKEIRESLKDELQELCQENIRLHLDFLRKLRLKRQDGTTMMDDITNPYLFDGERVNSLFQTAMNNSTKLTQSVLKAQEEEMEVEPPPPEEVNPLEAMEAIKRITGA